TGGGSAPRYVSQYCNGSRVPPECSAADGCGGPAGFGVPPGIVDASAPNPVFSLVPSATVDEGNNWINVSWGPLTLTDPSIQGPAPSGGTVGNYGGGLLLGNYSEAADSPTIDAIPITAALPSGVTLPPTDFFGNPRPDAGNASFIDYGAVEFQGTATTVTATLTSISPTSGLRGTVVNVTLTGTNLTGASAVNVSGGAGNGITVSDVGVVSSTTVVATFTISSTAPLATRNVSVVTPVGTTNTVTFTVTSLAPTLSSISPNSGSRGTAVNVTLTGTNLSGTTAVTVSGTGVTVSNIANVSATSVTATFTIANSAGTGNRNVSVTTANGTSNTVPFRVISATVGLSGPASMTTGGTGTKTGTITVTNTATGGNAGPLTMTAAPSIAKTGGTGNGTFSITGGTCTGTTVLPPAGNPGNSCTITVQYSGQTNTNTATGTVTLTDTGAATATQTRTFNAN
ncbi:MAG TPA: IPT/TIG domain-containing protein, partial [Candidatus Sulfotelmatobacter sp.]|nr:IPT/TIG domain-containing protein [Candidatus Sulfotelmatobacter sp.]